MYSPLSNEDFFDIQRLREDRADFKELRVLKHGMKLRGVYHRASYHMGELISYPKGTITVYAKDYRPGLPACLRPKNETDSQTDYFETDRAYITPDHPLYEAFLKQAK